MIKVFIDGSTGTTALRVGERLAGRSGVTVITLPEELRKDTAARKAALNGCDVAFLCLPDAAAKEAVSLIDNPEVTVIDASTAHRIAPGWAYGFAELSREHRAAISGSKRIAVPGCHASGFCALIFPLRQACVMPADYPVVCHSLTGYSGGGKTMISEYETPGRSPLLDSPRLYGLSQAHKHLPEMTKVCGLSAAPVFMPVVSDFYSGMLVSAGFHTRTLGGITPKELYELYRAHYEGQPLIRVMPLGYDPGDGTLASNALSGKDGMELFVCGNDERVTLSARFDNLGKGAGGAAIACMNISRGLDELTGLAV